MGKRRFPAQHGQFACVMRIIRRVARAAYCAGACAAARIAYEKKGCASKLRVLLKRGELHIKIDDQQHVHMFGPAERILKGEFAYV